MLKSPQQRKRTYKNVSGHCVGTNLEIILFGSKKCLGHCGAFHVRHDSVQHRSAATLHRVRVLNGVIHNRSAQRSQEVTLLIARAVGEKLRIVHGSVRLVIQPKITTMITKNVHLRHLIDR